MQKKLCFASLVFLSSSIFFNSASAQNVGIGTNNPDPSARLHISATNGGLLIPQINLSTASFPAPGPANGLLVWNTNASFGRGIGFYYNSGNAASPSWVRIMDNTSNMDLTNGRIWVGNSSGVANAVSTSGDATISNTGVIDLTNNAVETAEINDGAVTTVKIADNAVTTAKIVDNAITTGKIANGTITSTDLNDVVTAGTYTKVTVDAKGRVTTGANIVAGDIPNLSGDVTGAVNATVIANNAVNSTKIANGSVENQDLADNAVNSNKIQDNTVALSDIADNAINSSKIVNSSVENQDLANNAVNSIKIEDNTVSLSDIADNAINSNKIVNNSIENQDLADNAVNSNKIQDGTISTQDVADNAITSSKIQDGTIVNADILNVDASKITTGILPVPRGGTGAGSFTANGILVGNGTNAFSVTAAPSTSGQVLQWNGSAWAPASIGSSSNIYNADGSLSGNRIVTQGGNTLSFTSSATNGFSIDGTTFSVDAANNRIGIGTNSPGKPLEIRSNLSGAGLVNVVNTNSSGYSSIDFFDHNGNQMGNVGYANTSASSYPGTLYFASNIAVDVALSTNNVEGWRLKPSGFVGIGKQNPVDRLDVGNGNISITNDNDDAGELKLYERSGDFGDNFTAFRAQDQTSDITYTLPANAGTNGQVLTTNGSGTLSWASTSASNPSFTVGSATVSSGNNNNLNIGSNTFVRVSNGSNFTITGIAGGVNGRMIVLFNTGSTNMTISNQDSNSTDINRIITNASTITSGSGCVTLVYDGTAQRWIVVSQQN